MAPSVSQPDIAAFGPLANSKGHSVNEDLSARFEAIVTPVLFKDGYELVGPLVYKARWGSPDVEHLVFFEAGGKTEGLFSGAFGIRNREAEAFSIDAIRRYGGPPLKYNQHTSCTMRFSFHLIHPPFFALYTARLPDSEISTPIQHVVSQHIRPAMSKVTTMGQFMSLLIENERPCLWAVTNGAIRAAQIVVLASKSGLCPDRIRAMLEPRLVFIANGFFNNSQFRENPASYVDRLLADRTDAETSK